LVGAGVGDTNSTLVAGGEGPKQAGPVQQLVPVIILTSDNKKIAPLERPVIGIISIGRYVGNQPQTDNAITFKSKVISRHHAEIWTVNGEVYVRDSRSQSGTFLNAMRLSEPSRESKPYRLKPGDVVQFGVDYKGATEGNNQHQPFYRLFICR
jgi:pSer/pThr/pTyr-binding forkhead associated (FHA) protein